MPYIHPSNKLITEFSASVSGSADDLRGVCGELFAWFDGGVEYSRLLAPFFPLQRSDLDVLEMRAGTCGDYSNLIVSVLQALGFDARYAYVHRDCYGDAQDHICAAVKEGGRDILIDAAPPYRKWHGFDCPHREYELLLPDEFEGRMKKEEAYWTSVAVKHGRPLLAGLYYAPWVHAEPVLVSEEAFADVFYLLSIDENLEPALYAYYRSYTPRESSLPVMAAVTRGKTLFRFSIRPRRELWDDEQWSRGFSEAELTEEFLSEESRLTRASIRKNLPKISGILEEAGCRGLV